MSDHGPGEVCAACNAAFLIADALQVLIPDDCTILGADVIDCGTVCLSVWSDDCGEYKVTVTVEVAS